MFTPTDYLTMILIYLLIGALIGIQYILSYGEKSSEQDKAEILQHMLVKWPLHLYIMVGILVIRFLDKDD